MLDNRLVLPTPVAPATPWRFPVLAVLAPVVVSVALWLITGSLFALGFAALGPVTALASVGDQWWGGRRGAARERARFDREMLEARAHIVRAHSRERDALLDAWPDGPAILSRRHDRGLWHADTRALVVVLGEADIRSSLEVTPPAGSGDDITDIAVSARTLLGPFGADPRLGIGIVGPAPTALAVYRGLVLQLLRSLPPADYWMSCSDELSELWLTLIPHRRVEASDTGGASIITFGQHGHADPVIRLALGGSEAEIPPTCRIVVVTGPHEARVVQHPEPDARVSLRLAFVSQREAEAWVSRLRDDPRAVAEIGAALPHSVTLGSLLRPVADEAAPGLPCTPVVGPSGPVSLDLVAEGPHAVVAGTTGSGKSELLIAWVIAMAAEHSPERVSFLLIDFKGGSAFAPLASLPHVVGTINDLDEHEAERALASLRAELRYRETRLAVTGARGIEDVSMPRLVIVADEFAAMLAEFPDLHALFADIAARGRSLGVHLILCTQRPAGVVKDSLLANADLRLSLRVNNAADSHAVVGTSEASELSAASRGRVVVRRAGADTETLQVGLADAADADVVRKRWARAARPRRPWLDPLPRDIAPSTLARIEGGIALGAADIPEVQRQETFGWDPSADGNLLVIGGPRSGKSTTLAGIPGIRVPPDPPRAWDVVAEAADRLDTDRLEPGILIIDDLDAILSRFSGEHRVAWLDSLTRILREGPGGGFMVAASAVRLQGESLALAALFPSTILLGHPRARTGCWRVEGVSPLRHVLTPGGVSGATHVSRWHTSRRCATPAANRSWPCRSPVARSQWPRRGPTI
ncbi:S-DNA-T family DNA segregation ATPase FtsK/SpoIIIE [Microbacteriaceae bacterium SG_E_30_P1]|uniref:S-DNA-T family DNA segregation ATPase FtsK/SpoIIIE n=1 Tax=Antiquaquibacter oligotrophicus TaxID=2880260 RepID=A0ABT6KKQ3_9MICO|nr:FtsK/SpoIIIE domain-containing protein [Antiquaquibacter oligotrophicus]MDH6180577.1 S-DNA-T family DNA segregation ATPase FtsK/SpoIIIE [Antiquaquibacter oligotrophicus]UDF13690.1 cell division protein [Antiquaquibacter oligotrophicus]